MRGRHPKTGRESIQDTTFGSGCPGTTGTPAQSAAGIPRLNATISLQLAGARPSAPGLLLLGVSTFYWSGFYLPYDMAPLGAPLCTILNSGDYTPGFTTDSLGSATIPLFIPNNP